MAFVDVLTFIIEEKYCFRIGFTIILTNTERLEVLEKKIKRCVLTFLKSFMQIHHISHFNPSGNVDCL